MRKRFPIRRSLSPAPRRSNSAGPSPGERRQKEPQQAPGSALFISAAQCATLGDR